MMLLKRIFVAILGAGLVLIAVEILSSKFPHWMIAVTLILTVAGVTLVKYAWVTP